MQAINHVATALILKRKFPSTPLLGLIVATEAVEYLWVGLNVIGVEKTFIAEPMRSVADVHLLHMPFSHSLASSLFFALLVGGIILWRGGGRKTAGVLALAMSLALFSHIVLDLFTHAPDIAVAPFVDGKKYGSGLYSNWPLVALALETLWGVVCWRVYRGSKMLLWLILFLGVASVPIYSATINIGESMLGGQETVFALVILGQMIASSVLLWLFAREKPEPVVNTGTQIA